MRKNRDEGKGKKIIVYIMGFIMILSLFGVVFFGFGDDSSSLEYNGHKFVYNGNYWSTRIDGHDAMFTYFPDDVIDISIDENALNNIKNALEIDITSDVNDSFAEEISLAEYNMGLTLSNFNIFVRQGFASENNFNVPIITCDDSSSFVPVVYFRSSNSTNITVQDTCIIVEAERGVDIERVKDFMIYSKLGII